MPHKMIVHLKTKIRKITKKSNSTSKREVFVTWKKPQVLLAYFKHIEKAKKQLTKLNASVSNYDIIMHVVDQMYECN